MANNIDTGRICVHLAQQETWACLSAWQTGRHWQGRQRLSVQLIRRYLMVYEPTIEPSSPTKQFSLSKRAEFVANQASGLPGRALRPRERWAQGQINMPSYWILHLNHDNSLIIFFECLAVWVSMIVFLMVDFLLSPGGERWSKAAEFKHELPEAWAEAGANKSVIFCFRKYIFQPIVLIVTCALCNAYYAYYENCRWSFCPKTSKLVC